MLLVNELTLSGLRRLANCVHRVAIAGTLAQRPAVLLLDELTTFLDSEDQSAVLAAVAGLTRSNAGVTALWARPKPEIGRRQDMNGLLA